MLDTNFDKLIIGEDLDILRNKLGISVADACWLFGLSATKWTDIVKKQAKFPIKRPTLSIFVRILFQRIELSGLPGDIKARNVFRCLSLIDSSYTLKKMSILFGCESSSASRWITNGAEIRAITNRLFYVYYSALDEWKIKAPEAIKLVNQFENIAQIEAISRGVPNIWKTGKWQNGSLIANPHSIQQEKRVLGQDLDILREQLALSTMDACWLFCIPISKWSIIAKNECALLPLKDPSLSILVRVLLLHNELCPNMKFPDANDVFSIINGIYPHTELKNVAIMFGCESSAGYRWLTMGGNLSPHLSRLFRLFVLLFNEVKDCDFESKVAFLINWKKLIDNEARIRGVNNIFHTGKWSL